MRTYTHTHTHIHAHTHTHTRMHAHARTHTHTSIGCNCGWDQAAVQGTQQALPSWQGGRRPREVHENSKGLRSVSVYHDVPGCWMVFRMSLRDTWVRTVTVEWCVWTCTGWRMRSLGRIGKSMAILTGLKVCLHLSQVQSLPSQVVHAYPPLCPPPAATFGIALPSWIVDKKNSGLVLGLYILVFMVALPVAIVSGCLWANTWSL